MAHITSGDFYLVKPWPTNEYFGFPGQHANSETRIEQLWDKPAQMCRCVYFCGTALLSNVCAPSAAGIRAS